MIKFNRNKSYQSGGTIGGGSYSVPIGVPGIPKTQTYVTPLIDFKNLNAQEASETQTSSKGKKDKVEFKGLPTDVRAVNSEYRRIMAEIKSLPPIEIEQQSERYLTLMSELNSIVSDETQAKLEYDQKRYYEAETKMASVDSHGSPLTLQKGNYTFVAVMKEDSDRIEYVTLGEYAENSDKYRNVNLSEALTNRANTSAFDDNLLEALNNTSSVSEIRSKLDEAIKGLGHEEKETVSKGLQATAAMFEGYEGFTGFAKKTKSNAKALDSAKTIWNFLEPNQKALLKIEAVNRGAKTEEEIFTAALGIMSQYMTKSGSYSQSITLESDDDLIEGFGKGKGADTAAIGEYTKARTFENMQNISFSFGGRPINLQASRINGIHGSRLVRGNESLIAAGNTNQMYTLDGQSFDELDESLGLNAIIKSNETAHYVKLPVDHEGKPMLTTENADKISKFNELLSKIKDPNNEQMVEAAEKAGLSGPMRFKTFLAATVLTASKKNLDDKSLALKRVEGGELKKQYEKEFESINNYSFNPFLGFGYKLYETLMVIPETGGKGAISADNINRQSESKTSAPKIEIGNTTGFNLTQSTPITNKSIIPSTD